MGISMKDQSRIRELMKEFKLSYKQVRFAMLYSGNATQAARDAGYKSPEVEGCRLLKHPKVIRLMDRLAEPYSASRSKILDRTMLMTLWSDIAKDPTAKMQERLKAMDSLAKSQGIYIDRSQVISNVRIEHLDKLTDEELLGKLEDLLHTLQDSGITLALPEP